MKKVITLFVTILISIYTHAQRGKDGNKIVSATETVNAFTMLTSDASIGDSIINVSNSALNSNFTSNITRGDLILIIQLQGATIVDMPTVQQYYKWGEIISYNNCGNYEFVQVDSVLSGTSIKLDCQLNKNYTAIQQVMIVRVPRYNTLTINSGGILTTSQWNGTSGGILAVEVLGATVINNGGSIDVSGLGFRGGQTETNSVFGGWRYAALNSGEGAEKGEGIGGNQAYYDANYMGRYTRGAAANAGGGGNGHNAGGGGGANGGNINTWNKGIGNPDVSSANYITAWGLDTMITNVNANPTLIVSSGGGRGGYSHCANDRNELTVAPNNTNWGGDNRRDVGGLGGRPLDYSSGKIFMAGAGGAGDGNDVYVGAGGNGGGLVFIQSYDNFSGSGTIQANGQKGFDCSGPANPGMNQYSGKDAAGGGGGGGTVVIQTTGTVSGITINANGGNGGSQIMTKGTFAVIQEAEGPAGGGGGGYVAVSNGSPTININGGVNGTSNSPLISNFPPNGATKGGIGTSSSINAFTIAANNDSVCPNSTTTLTANIVGSAPGGTVLEWYDAAFNGNLLQTGNSFTTPVITAQTTYYVKTCPGTFYVPVTVYIDNCGVPPVSSFSSSDSAFCAGTCIDFTDLSTNTPSSWSWHFFGATTTTSSSQNPTNICYSSAGNYSVALVSTNPSGSDSLYLPNFITVHALPTIITSQDTSICIGDTAHLTASGGTVYTWSNGFNGQVQDVTPVAPTTYTVYVTNANQCLDSAQIDVSINSLPTILASNDTTICSGDAVNLSANGGVSYFWDNGLGLGQNHSPSPAISTTYTVTGTDVNGCSDTDQVIVTVGVCGVAPIASFASSDSSICINGCVNFTDMSQNLPTSWTWYFFGSSTPTSSNQNPTNICYTSSGTFDVALVSSNAFGTDSIFITDFITVNDLPVILASSDTSICVGSSTTISAAGGNSYIWDNGLGNGQSHVVSPTGNTLYTVIGTDSNGCVNTDQVQININSLPTIVTSPDTNVCINDTLKLRASGALSYIWDNGLGSGANHNVIVTTNNTYTVVGTDSNGCTNSSQVILTVNALPTIIASNDTTICIGDTAVISASGGFFYNWDNGLNFGAIKNVTPTVTTTYTVTGANNLGCRNTDQVTVSVQSCNPPVANLSANDTVLCINDCVDFTDLSTNLPTSWTWYFNGANPSSSTVQHPTNICYNSVGSFDVALVVSNIHGTDSIYFPNYLVVDSCVAPVPPVVVEPEVIIPNIFTPNADGLNDLYLVDGKGILEVKMNIFNRWGQLIFETEQMKTGWDGRTNSGIEVPSGTYYYVIEVTTTSKTETFTGYLSLLR